MMYVIKWNDKEEWNTQVHSFKDWDVYFLCEYAVSLMLHGDGFPYLFLFEDSKMRMAYVMMLNDLSNEDAFKKTFEEGKYLDLTTPYGYGGPLVEGEYNKNSILKFVKEMELYCRKNNIVSQFFRFAPWMNNQSVLEGACKKILLKKTIYMDTRYDVDIMRNMDTKNRNMVRKALKNGVYVVQDQGRYLNEFIDIYTETMERDKADRYYFFNKDYYEFLIREMPENVRFFYAYMNGKMISCAIILYSDRYAHYHLSGMRTDSRQYGSMNLLLFEAAKWAQENGKDLLHLGGGVEGEDSLYRFKKQFNKYGQLNYWIGSNIFISEKFNELVEKRKKLDAKWNDQNNLMIKYRG